MGCQGFFLNKLAHALIGMTWLMWIFKKTNHLEDTISLFSCQLTTYNKVMEDLVLYSLFCPSSHSCYFHNQQSSYTTSYQLCGYFGWGFDCGRRCGTGVRRKMEVTVESDAKPVIKDLMDPQRYVSWKLMQIIFDI